MQLIPFTIRHRVFRLVWRVRYEIGWRRTYWHLKRNNIEVIFNLPRTDQEG